MHGWDLCLLKPTLGPPTKFKHLTRVKEVPITWFRIGHTKATKSHILPHGPPFACHHCGQTLTIDHAPGVCSVTGKSWWILHSWLIEYSFCDSSWDLQCWIPSISGILLSNSQTIYTIPYWNQPLTDTIFKLELVPRQAQLNQAWLVYWNIESKYERHLLMQDG